MTSRVRSLTGRLVWVSAVWILLTLSGTGVWMVYLFHQAMERRFEQELDDHLVELVAASDLVTAQDLRLIWTPADPRFQMPFSGWYWEIMADGRSLLRSRSLVGQSLVPGMAPDDERTLHRQPGPAGVELGMLAQKIHFPEREGPLLFLIAGPLEEVARETRSFAGSLIGMLVMLGLGLMGAVVLQVRFGLIPLTRLRQGLWQIRSGQRQRLPEDFPGEVMPLVQEMNTLLAFQGAFLERVRSQSGDIAHALKNPLAMLRNEASHLEGEAGCRMREGLEAMAAVLEDRLAKARMAGTGNLLAARSDVGQVVADLCLSLDRLYHDKNLHFSLENIEGLFFRGDRHDLEEMLGNLLDNACKWGVGQVTVVGQQQGSILQLTIEDDGPGVAVAERQRLIQRGQRLDEAVPGSGLGLSIVANLVSLYQGEIRLETGSRGGLAVVLILPAA